MFENQRFSSLLFSMMIFLYYSIFLFNLTSAQIHRASNPSSYHLKYDSNYTKHIQSTDERVRLDDKQLFVNYKYLTWMFSLFGIMLVGLSGILPVLVLPRLANRHEDLSIKRT